MVGGPAGVCVFVRSDRSGSVCGVLEGCFLEAMLWMLNDHKKLCTWPYKTVVTRKKPIGFILKEIISKNITCEPAGITMAALPQPRQSRPCTSRTGPRSAWLAPHCHQS